MSTPFEEFVNDELPKRLSSNADPLTVEPDMIFVTTGVGLGGDLVPLSEVLEAGKSAYDLAVEYGFEGTEEEWLEFLQGEDGPPGPEGKSGAGLVILGSLNSTGHLPPQNNRNGDCYIIASKMYVWDGLRWAEVSQIGPTGPIGPRGPTGQQGPKGDMGPGVQIIGSLTAAEELPETGELGQGYIIDGHFWGWNGVAFADMGLIQGPQGPQGAIGPDGPRGERGEIGPIGPTGPIGEQGPQGRGLDILGVLPSEAALPTEFAVGDAYIIGSNLWVASDVAFVDVGPFVGPQGEQGIQGIQGLQGIRGERGEIGPLGPRGFEGPKGAKGDTGDQGIQGPMGPALNLLGKVADSTELPETGELGDGYLIDGHFWGWTGVSFEDLGPVQGPKGEQGPIGPRGERGPVGLDGADAYQVALDAGFEGTRDEWFATLAGPAGEQGEQGIQGEKGDEGPRGLVGPEGPQGPMGPALTLLGKFDAVGNLPTEGTLGDGYLIDGHFWGWTGNAYEDLGVVQGPQGERGLQGLVGPEGPQGPRGYVGERGPMGPAGPRGIRGLQGERGYKGDRGERGLQGERGIQGIQGIQGIKGDMGAAVHLLGKLTDPNQLPPSGEPGDGYLIAGEFWGWTGDAFENLGHIQGPQGEQGPQGIEGIQGPVGPEGPQGEQGEQGIQGEKGDTGTGLRYRGDVPDVSSLPTDDVQNGDTYSIKQHLYIWDDAQWRDLGSLQGPSAWDVFRETNPDFPGDVNDWLQSLNGNRWVAFSREPSVFDGNVGDFYLNTMSNQWFMKIDYTTWVPGGYLGGGTVYEAPVDTEQYVRRDGEWQILEPVMPEAPIDDLPYVRRNAAWELQTAEVPEAPEDGKQYVRKDAEWTLLIAEVPEVPTTDVDKTYLRRGDKTWVEQSKATVENLAPNTTDNMSVLTPKVLQDFLTTQLNIRWDAELNDWVNDQGTVADLLS